MLDMRSPIANAKALERARKALSKIRAHNVTTTLEVMHNAPSKKQEAFRKSGVKAKPTRLKEGISSTISNVGNIIASSEDDLDKRRNKTRVKQPFCITT
ncbi:hypothetical protein LSAT2_010210, partial [Lamellibrachia satsuma]